VISEFSTRSTDEWDVFTDPRIARIPVLKPTHRGKADARGDV
jgi:hypothetical protein